MEEWFTIRCLHNKGISIRDIAKQIKRSPATVQRYLKMDNQPKYHLNEKKESSLEIYKDDIIKMITIKKFNGSRIFEELVQKGYNGKRSAFYDYLKKIKSDVSISKISMPFETTPGKQTQFDWAHYTVMINDKKTKVYIFNVIMGYSRKSKFTLSLSMDQETVFEAIESAFHTFGGVSEELLMDNAKQMVDNANPNSFKWNKKFYSLCAFYGFTPKACKIRTPKTKGKVEKPFQYLENHFIKGNEFNSIEDMEKELFIFNNKVNNRIHSITKQEPDIKFKEEEQHLLNKLPSGYFISILNENRKVNWDSLISFRGNRYSVPYIYAGKQVWVRAVKGNTIKIFSDKSILIAEHKIPDRKGSVVQNNEHYDGLRKDIPKSVTLIREEFIKYFSNKLDFLENIIKIKPSSYHRVLNKILELRKYYSDEDISDTIEKCISWNRYSPELITSILRCKSKSIEVDKSNYHKKEVNNRIKNEKEIVRDLNYYDSLNF